MSNVPIVQGVAVDDSKYQGGSYQQHTNNIDGYQGVAPEHTPAIPLDPASLEELRQHPKHEYNDLIWAVLFYVHLAVMVAVIALGLSSANIQSTANGAIIFLVVATGLSAVGLSVAALSFMMQHAKTLVQTALIFSVISSLAIGILGFLVGSVMMGCLGLFSFAIGCCYAKIVWPRIPFAAANLNTALSAVRANLGVCAASFGMTALAFGWTIFWFLGLGNALSTSNSAILFCLFLSYYWVHQVLQNTMHVTTAGVVGTWWFVPAEANSFWSNALSDSLYRATTYSFGSVCFGSLLVAIVQALRALEYHARESDDLQLLSCIIQCILSCIQGIIEYLNRWAYVYVGLYGFSYLEAGRNVVELFKAKGLTAIISDDLAENVLFMVSLAIGLASGLVGLIIGFLDVNMFADLGFEHAAGPAFLVGFLAGFLFASIIMSVVGSAVNTVIVCYAEDPAAFQLNHPHLSAEMREAWVQAWGSLVNW